MRQLFANAFVRPKVTDAVVYLQHKRKTQAAKQVEGECSFFFCGLHPTAETISERDTDSRH